MLADNTVKLGLNYVATGGTIDGELDGCATEVKKGAFASGRITSSRPHMQHCSGACLYPQ